MSLALVSARLSVSVSVSRAPVGSPEHSGPSLPGFVGVSLTASPSRFLRIGVLFSDERIQIEAQRIRGSRIGRGGDSAGQAPGRGGERREGAWRQGQ